MRRMAYLRPNPSVSMNPYRWLLDLDPTQQRLIHHFGELDHILTARVRVHRELLDDGLVLRSRRREDIEVAQYLRAVDAQLEGARTGRAEESFSKVQPHRVARSCSKAGNRIGEVPHPGRLVYGHGSGIGNAAQINGVGVVNRAAA